MPAFDRRARDFEAASAQVLGISTDSPFSHENCAKAVGISHYPLLSDIHRDVSKAYGVYWPDWNANVRATLSSTGRARSGSSSATGRTVPCRSTNRTVPCRSTIKVTVRFVERYGKGELPDPDR